MEQGLRKGCNLAPLLVNIFFATMLRVSVGKFATDSERRDEGFPGERDGCGSSGGGACGLIYADDTGIVSRSATGLEKMMSVRPHGLGAEDGDYVLPAQGGEECRFAIDAAGHMYKQTDKFVYLGVDPLLYGYATWSLSAANYTAPSGAHRKFLTRVIGWRKGKRMDRPLSYA